MGCTALRELYVEFWILDEKSERKLDARMQRTRLGLVGVQIINQTRDAKQKQKGNGSASYFLPLFRIE